MVAIAIKHTGGKVFVCAIFTAIERGYRFSATGDFTVDGTPSLPLRLVQGVRDLLGERLGDADAVDGSGKLIKELVLRDSHTLHGLVDLLAIGAVVELVDLHSAGLLDELLLGVVDDVAAAVAAGAFQPAAAEKATALPYLRALDTKRLLHRPEQLARDKALVLACMFFPLPVKTTVVKLGLETALNTADVVVGSFRQGNQVLQNDLLADLAE